MDLGLENRVAVVLASSAGLGNAVAEALLAEGARVALSGRARERLDEAVKALEPRHGVRVFGEAFDVTDQAALERHLGSVRERWGDPEILVTNAGGPPAGTALDVTDEGLDGALDLTLRSAVHAVQGVLPAMRRRGFGRIVGLTSWSVREPIPSLIYSNVMRAGLTSYFKSLAREVARDGVLVNTVCSGAFATERMEELVALRAERNGRSLEEERAATVEDIPVGRLGDPVELASLVAFLCSARASYLTGVALPCDGGVLRGLL